MSTTSQPHQASRTGNASSRHRRMIRPADLAEMFGVNESTLWRWTKSGRLPCPMKLGPKTACWDSDVIDAWIAEKAKAA